jgi:hypothetical protein
MDGFGSSKRARHIAAFPDELMHIIFSKVEFQDKIRAGLVCKQWDQLLKSGTPAARHWEIDFTVKRIVETPDANKMFQRFISDHPTASIGRSGHYSPFLS